MVGWLFSNPSNLGSTGSVELELPLVALTSLTGVAIVRTGLCDGHSLRVRADQVRTATPGDLLLLLPRSYLRPRPRVHSPRSRLASSK